LGGSTAGGGGIACRLPVVLVRACRKPACDLGDQVLHDGFDDGWRN